MYGKHVVRTWNTFVFQDLSSDPTLAALALSSVLRAGAGVDERHPFSSSRQHKSKHNKSQHGDSKLLHLAGAAVVTGLYWRHESRGSATRQACKQRDLKNNVKYKTHETNCAI